jgi:hypothetical protein
MTLTGEGCLRKQTTRPPDILLSCASVLSLELKRGLLLLPFDYASSTRADEPFGPSQPSLVPKTCPQLRNAAGARRKRH